MPTKLFEAIPDQYDTMEELTAALRRSGLESSNVIIGVDYTKRFIVIVLMTIQHQNGHRSHCRTDTTLLLLIIIVIIIVTSGKRR